MQIEHVSRHDIGGHDELFSHVDVVRAVPRPGTPPAANQWSHAELFREPAGSLQNISTSA